MGPPSLRSPRESSHSRSVLKVDDCPVTHIETADGVLVGRIMVSRWGVKHFPQGEGDQTKRLEGSGISLKLAGTTFRLFADTLPKIHSTETSPVP